MDLTALYKISYGIYVISSKKADKFNGQIANVVFQVSSDPPIIAIVINKQNLTHEFIKESKIFTISILSKETPIEFIRDFGFKSGRKVEKFKNINYKIGITSAPYIVENSLAYIEAEVIDEIDIGTHTVFFGKIVNAEILKTGDVLTYEYYHKVKKGTAPKTAPTYIKEKPKVGKYRCSVCGYIYDENIGDPKSNIKPNVAFKDLPSDWVCPVCSASKSAFEKIS